MRDRRLLTVDEKQILADLTAAGTVPAPDTRATVLTSE